MASSVAGSEMMSKHSDCNKSDRRPSVLSVPKSNVSLAPPSETAGSRRRSSTFSCEGHPLLRRRSSFKGVSVGVTGMLKLRRLTMARVGSIELSEKPKIKYENTYKVDPDDDGKFRPDKVNRVAMEIVEEQLKDYTYSQATAGNVSVELASKIKNAVKALQCTRYRIICHVIVGKVNNQGIEAASRCLWDERRDSYTSVSYRNATTFVSATIHGVYFD